VRVGGEVHDRLRRAGLDRRGHRLAVLDRAAHEAEGRVLREVVEVLLPPRIGELVQHRHLVALLLQAQADEGRADEPRATADEQFHERIIPARAAR